MDYVDVAYPEHLVADYAPERGRLGAFIVELMLAGDMSAQQACLVARQWRGDAFVLARFAGRHCVGARIMFATEAAAIEASQVLSRVPRGTVAVDGRSVEFSRCVVPS